MSPAEKRALLAQLLAQRARQPKRAALSLAQERLWFIAQLVPGSSAYNVPVGLRLRGELHREALVQALATSTRRHETLRTALVVEAGRPVQEIVPELAPRLPQVDLDHLPSERREAEARRLSSELCERPFELSRAPLWRACCVRLGALEQAFFLVAHHAIFDDGSVGLLGRELGAAYGSYAEGRPAALTELRVQYADFARWQREHLAAGGELAPALAHWHRQLADLPDLELPTDRPRPAVESFRGRHLELLLPQEVLELLRERARGFSTTLFITLLAAFQTLLARASGQTDFAVGSPTAGRDRSELEPLIGFFVNMVALRAGLAGDPPFSELVRRVRATVAAALAHKQVPFETLAGQLRPQRDLSRNPLFQVVFVLLGSQSADYALAGSEVAAVTVEHASAKFDLLLNAAEIGGRLLLQLEHNSDLFDRTTIERFGRDLVALLGAVAADPERRLSRLPVLDPARRHQLLCEHNDTQTELPRAGTIHALVAEQAARSPEVEAVLGPGLRLTYRDLERRANQLAHHLLALGVRAEQTVGVCLERGAHVPVVLLAILKTGAAYLALDPGYPAHRLAVLIADAGCSLVMTESRLAERLPDTLARLALDTETERLAACPQHSPAVAPSHPDQLAYVLFTSGSTGKPKGVATPHRAIVRLVRGGGFAALAGEVFLGFAPLAFDASTLEIWGPLANGGRVVIMPPGPASLDDLGREIRRGGVTSLWLTAGLFHQMVEHRPQELRPLRQLLAGGDILSPTHVEQLRRALPELTLINGYGPTETTTFATCHRIAGGDTAGSVPIGRPIGNTRTYVVDRRLEPCPLGVFGELAIGGEGLARGYFRRPRATAERFVPDRFGPPGGRLYRSGDLARQLGDGRLELRGRLDGQVKVRGFRIEPGEVEAALAAHPQVRAAAVVALPAPGGGRQLAAGCVVDPSRPASGEQLRVWLRDRLPEPMVPALIAPLEALPLNANGKLDRAALVPRLLALLGAGEPAAETRWIAPAGDGEALISEIWQEVLGVARVGANESFFDLGGNSLAMVQVHQKLQDRLGRALPIVELFNHPTVRALALHLREQRPAPPPEPARAAALDRGKSRLMRQAEQRRRHTGEEAR